MNTLTYILDERDPPCGRNFYFIRVNPVNCIFCKQGGVTEKQMMFASGEFGVGLDAIEPLFLCYHHGRVMQSSKYWERKKSPRAL